MEFKELTVTEKVEHIWEYYKFPIIAITGTLIMVILITVSVIRNLNTEVVLDVTFLTTVFDVEGSEDLQSFLNENFVNPEAKKQETVLIEHIDVSPNLPPDQQTAYKAKLFGKSSNKMLDLIVIEEGAFSEYANVGMFLPLDEFIASVIIEVNEDALMYGKTEDDETEKVYGISIDNSLLDSVTGDNMVKVLAVFGDNVNRDNTITSLKLLVEN